MNKTGSAAKVKLNSFDDLFGDGQPQAGIEQVQEIALSESIFISLSGIAFKSCLMISMVGMIAWWSVTFLLFKILLISGLNMIFCSNNRELKIASITFFAVPSMSSERYWLSVLG